MDIYSKISKPLSQVAFAASAVAFLFAWFTSAGFYAFAFMGVCTTVPLFSGIKQYRNYGIALLVAAGVGAAVTAHQPKHDPYFVRGKVQTAYLTGLDFRAAVEDYWKRNHKWPDNISALTISSRFDNYQSLNLETNGTIRITLLFDPLSGMSLTLTPTLHGQTVRWRCFSNDVPAVYLPVGCKP